MKYYLIEVDHKNKTIRYKECKNKRKVYECLFLTRTRYCNGSYKSIVSNNVKYYKEKFNNYHNFGTYSNSLIEYISSLVKIKLYNNFNK